MKMKYIISKKYQTKIYTCLIVISSLNIFFIPEGYSQHNKIIVDMYDTKVLKDPTSNLATLVFITSDSLIFKLKGSTKPLQASYSQGQYTIAILPGSQVLTLTNQNGVVTTMHFSSETEDENTTNFPILKAGEKTCYKVRAVFDLIIGDGKGDLNLKHPKSYALVIFKTEKKGLALSFKSIENGKDNVAKVKDTVSEFGRYWVYIKPGCTALTISSVNYEDNHLKFGALEPYPVIYYSVMAPDTVDSYLIASEPQGATIQIKGMEAFNNEKHKTPYVLKKKCGQYEISLITEKYGTIKDVIDLCNLDKTDSLYKLTAGYAKICFNITPGLESTRIFSNEQQITPQKDNCFEFQKGLVTLIFVSPGFNTDTLLMNLVKDTIVNVKLSNYHGKGVTFTTYPKKVSVRIENGELLSEKSPFPLKLSSGVYHVLIGNPIYESKQFEVKITPDKTDYSFTLNPYEFPMIIKIKGRVRRSYSIYIDGKLKGGLNNDNIFNQEVKAGLHNIEVRNSFPEETVFTSKIDHKSGSKKKVIWLPSKAAWTVLNFTYSLPVSYFTNSFEGSFKPPVVYKNPSYTIGGMVLSLFGFSVTPVQIEKTNTDVFPDDPYIFSWINPEFRAGFNITNWIDFSLFFNAYYKNNPSYQNRPEKKSTYFDMRGMAYGIAFNVFPHSKYRWSWASLTFRAGIRNENVTYHIWDGYMNTPDIKVSEYNVFLSIGINLLSVGDGMIWRIVKKPLVHARMM
jgi:hypothetical protein